MDMATQSIDNVVSIMTGSDARNQRSRRSVKPESFGMVNDCRDIALKRIVEVLSGTFDKIEDELFEMAEKAVDRETQNMYLDARSQAREKRGAIEASFKKQFLSFFAQKVAGEDESAKSKKIDYASMELSLVNDSDLEEKLAVNDMAKRLSDKCDDELRALSQRMGFLLSDPEMNDDDNPMSPDTVIKALKVACDQMTSGFQTKLTVLRLVEQHMASEMLGVYRDVNSHLVARHVLPQIRPSYRKAQNPAGRKPAPSAPASSPTDAGNVTGSFANPAADIFATLQQLMAGGGGFDASLATGSASPPAFGVTTGSFSPPPPPGSGTTSADALRAIASGQPSVTSAGLVSALTQMQQQFTAQSAELGALAAMRAFVPGETPPADLNVLRDIRAYGAAQGGSPIDVMTIDIVAMLFDYVFEDKLIPDAVKGLLARLQIPALKVAILDKSFFSRKNHPTRRLLDVLAEASVGFNGDVSADDPLYRQIELVVERVHNEFDTDIQLFTDVLVVFEKFLAERETANAEFVEQSARAVHEREKREMARMIAQDETERRTEGNDLPAPVAAIMKGPWARTLERIYLREGGRHAGFTQALETADDLIWSVTPKANADERKRLVGMLPNLLRNLQQGMEIAAVEAEDRGRFFAALVDCHAAAVKAGLRGESVATLLAATQPNTDTGPLFAKLIAEENARAAAQKAAMGSGVARIHFTDGGVEIEELTGVKHAAHAKDALDAKEQGADGGGLPSSQGSVDFDVSDMPVVELKRGTWVEFLQDGGRRIRAKLSWISPLKGVYLFTNPGATEALSVIPDALQQQFRRGEARIIEESSMMDRAVDSLVHSLSGVSHA
jgi:Protein of unknown function (DUF1631)